MLRILGCLYECRQKIEVAAQNDELASGLAKTMAVFDHSFLQDRSEAVWERAVRIAKNPAIGITQLCELSDQKQVAGIVMPANGRANRGRAHLVGSGRQSRAE